MEETQAGASEMKRENSRSEGSAGAEDQQNKDEGGREGESSATNSKVSRKRTKTGCLTCRKRRIKCGEERPTCGNCIKSKRSCEGYNQPVVFKPGLGTIRPGTTYGIGIDGGLGRYGPYPIQPAPAGNYQPIAPAPPQHQYRQQVPISPGLIPDDNSVSPDIRMLQNLRTATQATSPYNHFGINVRSPHSPNPPLSAGSMAQSSTYFQRSPSTETFASNTSATTYSEPRTIPQYQHSGPASSPGHPPGQGQSFVPGHTSAGTSCPFNPPLDPIYSISQQGGMRRQSEAYGTAGPSDASGHMTSEIHKPIVIENSFHSAQHRSSISHEHDAHNDTFHQREQIVNEGPSTQDGRNYYDQEFSYKQEQEAQAEAQMHDQFGQAAYQAQVHQQQAPQIQQPPRPRIQVQQVHHYQQPQQEQIYQQPPQQQQHQQQQQDEEEEEEDGPYDVEDSEVENVSHYEYDLEEMEEDVDFDAADEEMQEVYEEAGSRSIITGFLNAYSNHPTGGKDRMITYQTYLPDPQALRAYYPSYSASPLMNPTTAKIFCHFVYVLGPSLSIFERTSPNPGVAFTTGTGLQGPQNIWSYTIPMLSLQHPPLLHALLALSSLHLAKLTRGVENSSLLHYNIALRRLGKAIGDPKQRLETSTLAATLLLAFYETMAGEHNKWSRHIHGAKLLIKEIDFQKVGERIKHLDAEEAAAAAAGNVNPSNPSNPASEEKRRMLAIKKGKRAVNTNAAQTGNNGGEETGPKRSQKNKKRRYSRKELENCQLQADLFWWYCKMDGFQSILSGGPLVLDYVFWSQCPPRASVGTLGTYGSSDRLLLLQGRVADFQARDAQRKKAVEKANGGQWLPPPEMGGPPRGMFWRRTPEPVKPKNGEMDLQGMGIIPPGKLNFHTFTPEEPKEPEIGVYPPVSEHQNAFLRQQAQQQQRRPSHASTPGEGYQGMPQQNHPPTPVGVSPSPGPRGPPQGMGGPPPGWTGGPPPGWNGGPPPGWTGGPPSGMGGPPSGMSGPPQGMGGPSQGAELQSQGPGGPPPGWTGGPPPGWKGGPPPGWTDGPPAGMTGSLQGMTGPPQGMNGPPQGMTGPPQGMGGPPQDVTGPPHGMDGPPQGMTGGPPPGWMGGPPPGWTGGPPPGWIGGPPPGWTADSEPDMIIGGPPSQGAGGPPQSAGGPPPGWTGGPPPGWKGGPPPGWKGGPPPGFGGPGGPAGGMPPGGVTPEMMQQYMARMQGGGGPPGMGGPPPPDNEPKMYGMTPVAEKAYQLPRAFAEVYRDATPPTQEFEAPPHDDFAELEAATVAAEKEWAEIKQALHDFQASLGPDYAPMDEACMPRRNTPFGGPAIYYRTFPMAILHTLYYTSLIILERCHPSMPAMSMQAAMVCASRTEEIANKIGRVTVGLFPDDPSAQINPARGASLIESTIPLFFAGVQYKEKEQREWLKHKLREIHRITGWASASRVLLGCYRAWEIAGERGLADPFRRPPDSEEEDVPRPEYETAKGSPMLMEGGVKEPQKNFVLTGHRLELAVGLLGEPSLTPTPEERRIQRMTKREDSEESMGMGGSREGSGSGSYGRGMSS